MKLSKHSRFGAFFSRVETERDVLSIINSVEHFPKLHGLTALALEQWAAKAHSDFPKQSAIIEEISYLLHRISLRSDAHADQSRVVFANEISSSLPAHDLVERLRILCIQ